MPYIESNYVNI